MRYLKTAVASLLFPLLAGSASAQTYTNSYGYSFNNPISATCSSMFWNKMNARLTYRALLQKRGYTDARLERMSTEQMLAALKGQVRTPARAETEVSGGATTFRPAAKRLLLPTLARSLVQDAAQQRALLGAFEQALKGYETEAARSGLANDVAGAIAFFIGASYLVYRQGEEPNDRGLEHLARAIRENLDTPGLKRMTDGDKQKFYELMVGLGTYLAAAYQQAVKENNLGQANQLRQTAAATLKGYLKLDPARIRITEAGLEIGK